MNSRIGGRSQRASNQQKPDNKDLQSINLNSPEPIPDNKDGDVTAQVGSGFWEVILQNPSARPSNLPEPGDDLQYPGRGHPLTGTTVRSQAATPALEHSKQGEEQGGSP